MGQVNCSGNKAISANEVIEKYNSAWKFYGEQKHKEAADDFAYVINTMLDPEWQSYTQEINSHNDALRKELEEMDKEFSGLCFHAAVCCHHYAYEREKEGDLEEALTYKFNEIGYLMYSGKHQDSIDLNMQVLAGIYARYGNFCKSKGKTKEADDYYQRAANLAEPEQFEYLRKQGIDLSNFKPTVDTINNDASDRYDAKNYGVAAYLWRKTADMGDAVGQYNLGRLYYLGIGVPKDYSKSFELEREAAERGNRMDAMNYMGLHYWNGIFRNLSKAQKYFEKAAKMGSEDAKKNLKNLRNEMRWGRGFLSFVFGLLRRRKGDRY